MDNYYVFKNPNKKKSKNRSKDETYSLDELKDIPLYRNTYILKNAGGKFTKACEFPELKDIVIDENDPSYFGYEIVPPDQQLNASMTTLLPYLLIIIASYVLLKIFLIYDLWLLISYALSIFFYIFFSIFWFKKSCGTIGHSYLKMKMINIRGVRRSPSTTINF